MCVIFLLSWKCFLVSLVFRWRYKDVELYFYFVFRSDPKLFTDDTDIKYCKALNCCKLPKVGAGVNFVPFTRQISLLVLFLIHDWNIWPTIQDSPQIRVEDHLCFIVNVCFRNPLAKETDFFTQGPKFNFLLLKNTIPLLHCSVKKFKRLNGVNFLEMNKLRQRIHEIKKHPRCFKYTCFTATVIWLFFEFGKKINGKLVKIYNTSCRLNIQMCIIWLESR